MKRKKTLKVYKVDFDSMWGVTDCCLVIAAKNCQEATKIASETIKHITKEITVTEVDISTSSVIVYISGDY